MTESASKRMKRTEFRPEVQALRAIAVLLVVTSQLWPTRFPGGHVGIDVFFVITGFLISLQLLREADNTGTVKLARFWRHHVRRLLPTALVVLAASALITIVWLPKYLWPQNFTEIGASALSVLNWIFAIASTDDLAQVTDSSVVQQFWALSIVGQIYLIWPVLVLVAIALAGMLRKLTRRIGPANDEPRVSSAAIAMLIIFLGSFALSITMTARDPSFAFFATATRAWEFAAGGLLACAVSRSSAWWRIPATAAIRTIASWTGLTLIIFAAFRFSGDSAIPGYLVLLPVVGTLLIIWAGHVASTWSPTFLGGFGPVQLLGNASYAMYLWSWPLIVLYLNVWGKPPGLRGGLAILVLALGLALVTKFAVENLPGAERNRLSVRRSSTVPEESSGITRPRWVRFVALPMALLIVAAGVVTAEGTTGNGAVVVEPDLSAIQSSADAAPAKQMLKQILVNSTRYSVSAWYPEEFKGQEASYLLNFGGVDEHDIRPAAMAAFSQAVALRSGALAPATSETDETTRVTVKLIRSLSATHWSNSRAGWGSATSWQGALWAEFTAFAAWLMWDELPSGTRESVSKLLVAEADRFIDYEVPYWKSPDGTEQFVGDSKAEENSWNSMLLQVAIGMMPNHPHWKQWNDKNTELMLSSFATPEDEDSNQVYQGRQLRNWLNGSNIENDGRVYNHKMLHPDYMTTIMHTMHMVITSRLAGQATPTAALHNTDLLWDAFTSLTFDSPPYVAPGGTIYNHDSDTVYYPEGTDWGTSRRMQFVGFDAFYWAFGSDARRRGEASDWLLIHAPQALGMQERFDDGRTYGEGDDDTYRSREQWVAMYAAWSYLAIQIGRDFTLSD